MDVYATSRQDPCQRMLCKDFDGVVPRSIAESKSLPEGSDLGLVATQIHAAPATTVIFAGVVEPEDAFGIFTFADSGVIRCGEKSSCIVRYRYQEIRRLFQYPTGSRLQSPVRLYYLGRKAWLPQLFSQNICKSTRYAPNSCDSLHRAPKNTSQSASRLKRNPGLWGIRPDPCQPLRFGRRSQVRVLEPLGKVSEALQEIGADPGEENLCVYKV
jgi:hypothetical protein